MPPTHGKRFKALGVWLYEWRLKRRLTTTALSKLSGVSQPLISQLERRNRLVSVFAWARLVDALRIPPGEAHKQLLALARDPKLAVAKRAMPRPTSTTREGTERRKNEVAFPTRAEKAKKRRTK